MSEPCANAILVARQARLVSESRPTLLHAFQPLVKGKMLAAGTAQAAIDEYVASERQQSRTEVAAFLAARGLDREQWPLRIEEGAAGPVLSRSVREIRADVLVMGTRGRPGLLKVLIGSVTEEALRSLNVDILAVPLASRWRAVAQLTPGLTWIVFLLFGALPELCHRSAGLAEKRQRRNVANEMSRTVATVPGDH